MDMINGYAKGITPNPDVLCNKSIKFGFVFDKSKSHRLARHRKKPDESCCRATEKMPR